MTQNVMSGYYGQPYQQSIDPTRSMDAFMQPGMVPDMAQGMVDTTMAGSEGQTLDQIISQNDLELQRRRSTMNPDFQSDGGQEIDPRRPSMLAYGSSKPRHRPDFQFDSSPPHPPIRRQIAETGQSQKASDPRKLRSRENLALDTRFVQMNPVFGSMSSYSPAIMTSTPLELDPASRYLSSNMEIPMSFENSGEDRIPVNVQSQMEQPPIFTASPTHQTFSPMFQGLGRDSPAGHGSSMEQSLMDKVSRMRVPDSMQNMTVMHSQSTSPRSIMPTARGSGASTMATPVHPPPSSVPSNTNGAVRGPYGNGSKQSTAERSEGTTDM